MAISFELQMDEGPETEAGEVSGHSKELRYFAHVTNKERHADVREAAKAELPINYFNLIRTSVTIPRRVTFDTIFEVILEFKHPGDVQPKPRNAGDTRVSIRSEGGSQFQMLFSLNAIEVSPNSVVSLSDDLAKRGISVGKDGQARGVQVESNSIVIVVETIKSGALVNERFLLNAASAKGKVNGFPYKGFPRGSLRLINFDAQQQANPGGGTVPDWSMNFAFHFEPSVRGKAPMWDTDQEKFVDVPYNREGHWFEDYYRIEKPEGAVGKKFLVPAATKLTLHQIFEYEDFETLLGI